MIDQTIAHYRISAKLGQGGMGEVYQATDTRLGREVAIKVLPESFAKDRERLARFQREAQVLASLSHPNIAAVHGLEESGDTKALVLELVEGQTLAECLERGPLPVEEALDVCKQIAEALEAAHEKGIIHRDLKPGNVKLTPDGKVKVLDFGLAKVGDPNPKSGIRNPKSRGDLDSPTLTADYTLPGTVLGTAAYMSPEQAKGKPVDTRSDIWSFGCVLFECITGKRAFGGDSATEIIGAVIHAEPDWTKLSPGTPSSVSRVLRRCLVKDPRSRLHDIADARIELCDVASSEIGENAQTSGAERGAAHWLGISLPWGLVATLLLLFLWSVLWSLTDAGRRGRARHGSPQRLSILTMPLPKGMTLDISMVPINLDVSPDGSQIVFTGRRSNGATELFLRAISELEASPVRGTLHAVNPFFSDDGKSLGYAKGAEIRTVAIRGSEHNSVAASDFIHGADWGSGRIVFCFAPAVGLGLTQVDVAGGPAQELTKPDLKVGAYNHFFPQILPGGTGLLYTVSHGVFQEGRIVAQSMVDSDRVEFIATGSYGRYVSSGHVIYGKAGSLWAVPFDLERLKVLGPETEVVPQVMINPFFGLEMFAVSQEGNGTLVYAAAADREFGRRLAWIDLEQRTLEYVSHAPVDGYESLSVRQIGTSHVALVTIGRSRCDVWMQRLDRPGRQNLASHPLSDFGAIWSNSGEFAYFCSDRNGLPDIFRMRADGGGEVVSVVQDEKRVLLHLAISPDDSKLAYVNGPRNLTGGIWILDLATLEQKEWMATPAFEEAPSFSPKGDWIVYHSKQHPEDEFELFISPLNDPQRVIQVATGEWPVWHPDGDKIYYQRGDDLMLARLDPAHGFRVLGTERFMSVPAVAKGVLDTSFDITPDGKRILIIMEELDIPELKQLVVVQNWFNELKRLVPPE